MSVIQALTGPQWRKRAWGALVVADLLALAVFLSRWFLESSAGQSFLAAYPGQSPLPAGAPGDAPWWLEWQHGVNVVLMILLIRSGWMVHSQRKPEAYWTRNNTGRIRTKRSPTKMSLYLWLHLTMDVLWVVNGIIFVALLFITGEWERIVPVHWNIVPNAISAGLQYLSLSWPTETPWINYNALQVLAYGIVILILAPISAITGIRLSPVWRGDWRISRVYRIEIARAIHLPAMFAFAVFIVIHVALVFLTGMRSNLNYMYSWEPGGSVSWWGFVVFLATLLVIIAAWIAARPLFMQAIAALTGKITTR